MKIVTLQDRHDQFLISIENEDENLGIPTHEDTVILNKKHVVEFLQNDEGKKIIFGNDSATNAGAEGENFVYSFKYKNDSFIN